MEYPGENYNESKVPPYSLPDPLVCADGTPVTDPGTWLSKRRPELLGMFEEYMYGKTPPAQIETRFELLERSGSAFEGTAERRQVVARFSRSGRTEEMDILLYLPTRSPRPVGLFAGLNFHGNHAISIDPGVRLPRSYVRNSEITGVTDNRASDASRGTTAGKWDIPQILRRGYGLATAYCGDLDPDFDDGFINGIHPLFYREGQARPDANEWGAIGAWAWGLSRIMDYIQTDPDLDEHRVAVMGHSRLGKTALWASAQDPRFAITVSVNSGCGGAALSRRLFGETVETLIRMMPFWFCRNFRGYANRENDLPIDQHMLISLIAPRPVYVASAEDDPRADPKGEFLAARHADPVYRLLGTDGIASYDMPGIHEPITSTIGYHIRSGKHAVTPYDWEHLLNFADRHMPPGV
ncbi:MAG: acetylxylan esterase [Chitinivibrionales bacterium]|nr:acetylxylan esterase [Chitinivibrionales bacterium]MBD3394962.1 acetylxylan esterase [Chitinivibrionales bacterium]